MSHQKMERKERESRRVRVTILNEIIRRIIRAHCGFYNKKADKKGKVLGPSFLILLKEYDT